MQTIVHKIALNMISQDVIDKDLQLLRIQKSIIKMKERYYKTISYHGKMRVQDVELLEELRKHNRSILKKKRVEIMEVRNMSLHE